jgi:hypothetical protein
MSSFALRPQASSPLTPPNISPAARTASNHCALLENHKMGILTYAIRSVRNAGISNILMGGTIALGATLANSSPSPAPESIHATFAQTGSPVSINLTIDTYSTPSDLAILSRAFQDGHDQALVTALSKTKAVGHCSIAGTAGYDIAFIQTVVTPTGRRITFVTNRPLQLGEATSRFHVPVLRPCHRPVRHQRHRRIQKHRILLPRQQAGHR